MFKTLESVQNTGKCLKHLINKELVKFLGKFFYFDLTKVMVLTSF